MPAALRSVLYMHAAKRHSVVITTQLMQMLSTRIENYSVRSAHEHMQSCSPREPQMYSHAVHTAHITLARTDEVKQHLKHNCSKLHNHDTACSDTPTLSWGHINVLHTHH
eukprot:Lankesteria_metandrocarpae@DN1133_c0_g1_i1.p1